MTPARSRNKVTMPLMTRPAQSAAFETGADDLLDCTEPSSSDVVEIDSIPPSGVFGTRPTRPDRNPTSPSALEGREEAPPAARRARLSAAWKAALWQRSMKLGGLARPAEPCAISSIRRCWRAPARRSQAIG